MKNILISDVTLRELKKSEAFFLGFKEKLEIAKKISELKADAIELCPVSDKADEILVKTICACIGKTVVACEAGYTIEEVEKHYGLISGAKNKRLLISIPVSPVQIEYVLNKKPKAVLELLRELTEKAASLCGDVEVSFEDATRAEQSFLEAAVKTAILSGAKTVTLNDTEGSMLPSEFGQFIKSVFAAVPEMSDVELAVSISDSYSMANASIYSAIEAGASKVKLSAMGRLSVPTIESFIKSMEVIGAKKGYCSNLNRTGALRIIKQIAQLAADKSAFTAFGNVVGEKDSVISKDISQVEFRELIDKLGYSLAEEDFSKVFSEFARLSDKKEVRLKELDVIIANTALQVPETYALKNFSVSVSNISTAMAGVTLSFEGKDKSGISFGNGSIDAALLAIESITGRHFDLDDFEVTAVTEGKEAMGQTVIKLRSDGRVYSGRGISTDIVGASIRAYVNALNKIVYEEKGR